MKNWQTSAIIWEISYTNLETRRYGPKSGVSRIIQESLQHLHNNITVSKNRRWQRRFSLLCFTIILPFTESALPLMNLLNIVGEICPPATGP